MTTNKQEQTGYTPNELTLMQRVALEGEVSMCYETAMHEPDKEFNTYVLCCTISPEYLGIYREAMLEHVDEEVFNKCYRYAVQEMFPTTLFINKLIADIKGYTGCPDCQVKEKMPKVPKQIFTSKFVSYVRTISGIIPATCRELLEAIMADDTGKLDFLQEISFSLSLELACKKDTVTNFMNLIKLTQVPIIESPIIPFMSETKDLESKSEKNSENKDMKKAMQSILDSLTNTEKPVTKKYYVMKIDKATKMQVMKKAFDTQAEAIDYCKGIERDYKELLDRYDFKIVGE